MLPLRQPCTCERVDASGAPTERLPVKWTSHVMPTGHPSIQERRALERLRDICRTLPETVETTTFGHPTFQAGRKRTFAVLDDHEQPGMLCLVLKLEAAEQAHLIEREGLLPVQVWRQARVDGDARGRRHGLDSRQAARARELPPGGAQTHGDGARRPAPAVSFNPGKERQAVDDCLSAESPAGLTSTVPAATTSRA